MTPSKCLLAAAALAAALVTSAAPASAATLEVEFTGLDVYYGFDGKRNLQSGPVAGNVDAVDAATFYVDGETIGTLVGDIQANIGIAGFDDIPADGGTRSNLYTGGYFRIDFHASDLDSGLLNLGINRAAIVDVTYVADRLQLTVTGETTGISDQQPLDRLPAWPGFSEGDEVRFTFSSSNLSDLADDGERLTRFRARGSGTLAQQNAAIPEPSGLALAAVAGAGLLGRRRRRPLATAG